MRNLQLSVVITNRESDSVEMYFSELGRQGMVTAEEEVQLAKKIRTGDRAALNRLVNANLRFVVSVAKKYQNQGLPLSDLISEGNLGLIKAATRFDETRGFKFISFAVWWIRQSIMAAITENARMIRLPMNKLNDMLLVNKAAATLEQQLLHEPTEQQLADFMDSKLEKVSEALYYTSRMQSYDKPVGESGYTLIEQLSSGEYASDTDVLKDAENRQFGSLLSCLSPRERRIIEMTFGIGQEWAMSPTDISQYIRISAERVRQIRDVALGKLRKEAASATYDWSLQ